MPGPFSDKPHLGGYSVKKITGQTSPGPALLVQTNIPIQSCLPYNLPNNAYSPTANAAAGPVNFTKGKKSVGLRMTAAAKASWFTYLNIADWLGAAATYLDTNLDTSSYALNLTEPVLGNRIFTGAKLQSLIVIYNAAGGDILTIMDWMALYGDNEDGSPPSFTAYATSYGQNYAMSDMTVNGFDQDRSFTTSIVRAQAQQNFSNQTVYGNAITSHAIGGSFLLEQAPTYTSTPTSTCYWILGPTVTGVKVSLYLNLDEPVRTFPGTSPGSKIQRYSLGDFAGANSGYPVSIIAAP